MQSDTHHPRSFELHDFSKMDRIRNTFKSKPTYAPVNTEAQDEESESYDGSGESLGPEETPFSWIEYFIFTLLGVAMLWAWYDSHSG
jgi:solute carrier family 29 (equilibrative nucleoside transporter), member 1/2/3